MSWDGMGPFARSGLSRTPPKSVGEDHRSRTDTDDEAIASPEEQGKRKRRDEEDALEKALRKIALRITKLDLLVKGSTNTKREIKEVTEELRCLGEHLTPERLSRALGANTKQPKIEKPKKVCREISTQTDGPWGRIKPLPKKITEIGETNTVADFQAIADAPWDGKVYQATSIQLGNPIATDKRVVKCVLIEPKDLEMKNSVHKLYAERFPELRQMTGPFEVLEQVTRRRTDSAEESVPQKVVKILHDGTETCIWERLTALKEECVVDEQVAIHHVEAMPLERLRKMAECIFRGTPTRVKIYTTRGKQEEGKPRPPPKKTIALPAKERTTCALTVEGEGKSYKEVLQSVRAALNSKPEGERIRAIRSTKDNRLLIVLDKDQVARDELKKLITESDSRLKAKAVGPVEITKTETFHVRGMDALTTVEEVQEAVKGITGSLDGVKIGGLRPAANNTQAVTIVVGRDDAHKMEEGASIKIGPVKCSVQKRIEVRQCFRCWGFDHKASECKGTDRSRLCKKCGGEGHFERDCPNAAKCLLCKDPDHKMGSNKCKMFQAALTKTKRAKETTGNEPKRQ